LYVFGSVEDGLKKAETFEECKYYAINTFIVDYAPITAFWL